MSMAEPSVPANNSIQSETTEVEIMTGRADKTKSNHTSIEGENCLSVPYLNKSANTAGMLSYSSRSKGNNSDLVVQNNSGQNSQSREGGSGSGLRHNETIHELIAEEAQSDRLTHSNDD